MSGYLSIGLAILVLATLPGSQNQQDGAVICKKIQSYTRATHSRKDPQLVEYLKSLTPSEALDAARYTCVETENNAEFQQLPAENRSIGATKAVLLCLSYFFQNCESIDAGGDMLLGVAADKREPSSLRRAIVTSMTGGTSRRYPALIDSLGAFAQAHEKKVNTLLTTLAVDKEEVVFLRSEAVRTLAVRLRAEAHSVGMSDPEVQEAIQKRRKHTDKSIDVGQLVRSGDATLTDETMKALEPVVVRTRINVKLLANLVADDTEPKKLREDARRALENYRRSVITVLDAEIDSALQ